MEKIENLIPMAVFARVVETLSFTEAALTLGMSKSSVSRDISVLEKRIGAMLLKRTTRKIEITELGLSYYQHCFKILNELRAAERFIQEYYEEPTGTIKILAPVTFGKRYVLPTLNTYLKRNIMANVVLDLSDKEVDIKESQYDLSIVVSQSTPTHEYTKYLCTIQWGLYATPDFIARMRPILTPKDLPTHSYILFCGVARTISLPFRKEKQKINIDIHSRFRSNNSIALINMALSGFGIAYLPNYVARESVAEGKLVRILPNWQMDEYKVWLLTKARNTMTSGIKQFIDELQQLITSAEFKDPR
ncbi:MULTISPECIES: LysR family transcriptional regulator [Tenebrionibacter/Tenebrionicola group]|jgi:DNA-binding transcriptional LysR family regulator|uniref:LysR family transcriptional regulator n=2 Tax=Tenebrionibacter/Tenebrionicola group TaxID=2969848 RepID=A0A8K0XYH0_9ENTR|nr:MULTISPECIES: LysR family transcriptional regulator [Tenebrionibacter/Tenebrionicola group]MBK4716658.1 LysR family transcriptional regulator [Tenebrionibacter intestinalis]MBV5097332.1 LysR family transcriptional regulator [Tenebrionicola larvae]